MIGDHYREKWRDFETSQIYWPPANPAVTKAEFDALRREVEEMKALLKRAKTYDERNNEPNCEIEDKMDFLRKVAKLVGVDLDDVIGPKA